jgi:hypothetical protein
MAGRRNRFGGYTKVSRDALASSASSALSQAKLMAQVAISARHAHLFDGSTAALVSGVHPYREVPDAALTQMATAPGSGVLVSTSASTVRKARRVFGYFSLTATGAVTAVISCLVETSVASGAYNTVVVAQIPAGVTGAFKIPYQFDVLAGLRYKFVKGGGSGVTETISAYSFMEW